MSFETKEMDDDTESLFTSFNNDSPTKQIGDLLKYHTQSQSHSQSPKRSNVSNMKSSPIHHSSSSSIPQRKELNNTNFFQSSNTNMSAVDLMNKHNIDERNPNYKPSSQQKQPQLPYSGRGVGQGKNPPKSFRDKIIEEQTKDPDSISENSVNDYKYNEEDQEEVDEDDNNESQMYSQIQSQQQNKPSKKNELNDIPSIKKRRREMEDMMLMGSQQQQQQKQSPIKDNGKIQKNSELLQQSQKVIEDTKEKYKELTVMNDNLTKEISLKQKKLDEMKRYNDTYIHLLKQLTEKEKEVLANIDKLETLDQEHKKRKIQFEEQLENVHVFISNIINKK